MTPALTAMPGTQSPRRPWALHGLLAMALIAALGLLAACSRPMPDQPAAATSTPSASPADKPAVTPVVAVAAPPATTAAPAIAPSPAPGNTAAANAPAAQPTAPLPTAVVAFQKQRDACDHFRGEEPYDKPRAAFLKAQLIKTCKGTDRALAALRQRYAQHPEALAALKGYEDRIE